MSDQNRFSLKRVYEDGSSTYGAPHELWNEVIISFPTDYFHPWPPPQWVDIPGFHVIPAGAAEGQSGIGPDDDPHRHGEPHPTLGYVPPLDSDPKGIVPEQSNPLMKSVGKGKCDGCGDLVALRFEGEVVPQLALDTPPTKVFMCGDCWEVANHADIRTGAYGAASAEVISAWRVRL